MDAIQFRSVEKWFRVGRPWGIKDALLGAKGQRHRAHRVNALSDVTFHVREGETIGLLGHNGSGKSTALKLIAQTIVPSRGIVTSRGRVVPLLELGAGFHPDLTGRENVFLNGALLGLSRKKVKANLDSIIDFSELEDFFETPVRFYSSGMAARLGFAVAVHVDPEVLLLDEVLAVGDEGFQAKCLARMSDLKQEGRTLVLVTHSLTQAQGFCDRALILDRGRLIFDGPAIDAGPAYATSTSSAP